MSRKEFITDDAKCMECGTTLVKVVQTGSGITAIYHGTCISCHSNSIYFTAIDPQPVDQPESEGECKECGCREVEDCACVECGSTNVSYYKDYSKPEENMQKHHTGKSEPHSYPKICADYGG